MKKIISFLIIFTLIIPTSFAASFTDVSEDHQYYAAIESLKNLKIIDGYPDQTFQPEKSVNRVEALKMILNSAGIESPETTEETGFPDSPADAWYAKFIINAKSLGIVDGNADGTFAPARLVNKAEFLKMLLESFEIDLSKHQNIDKQISSDTSLDQWFIPYFSYAKTVGIISPTLDNRLEPDKILSRGETSEIIYKLLVLNTGGDTQKMLNIAEAKLVEVLVNINDNNIASAINNANDAVFYTEQAISLSPEENITKAANQISLGFKELCLAYQSGIEGNNDALLEHANNAEEHAGKAYEFDSSTQVLIKFVNFIRFTINRKPNIFRFFNIKTKTFTTINISSQINL